jgi:hypothetical protein
MVGGPADAQAAAGEAAGEAAGDKGGDLTADEPAGAQAAEAALKPEVRRAVLAALTKKKRLTTAANLEKSLDWEASGDTLVIPFDMKFSAEHVGQDLEQLAETVAAVLGQPVRVQIRFVPQAERVATSSDEEARVEMTRRVFRGEIIK